MALLKNISVAKKYQIDKNVYPRLNVLFVLLIIFLSKMKIVLFLVKM